MFTKGTTYRRKELHDQFGGNRQGGIASSAKHPYIFIFTGENGLQHGYEDGWDTENVFYYTGEGQSGDMQFIKGNKAIVDSQKDNKSILLFKGDGRGYCEFISELEYLGFDYFPTPDTSGNIRQGIKFRFTAISDLENNLQNRNSKNSNHSKPNKTERQGLITSRVGQGWYRIQLLNKWHNKCAVTNLDSTNILIASHIIPWKESTDEERLDPENGILLSPNLDALFDKHLISFDDSGNILLSELLSVKQYQVLGINDTMKLQNVTKPLIDYLKRHREIFNETHNPIQLSSQEF